MKVLIYPKSVNPYLEMLYAPMRRAFPDDTFEYLAVSPLTVMCFPLVAAWKRLQGYKVFHLHWHAFYLDAKYGIPDHRLISFVNTLVCLTALKVLGYKLVWTVHNVLPHEPKTSNDRLVTRYTARLAARLIVHSKQAIEELREVGAATDKATVIPHGNYAGVYPNNTTRTAARKRLGVAADEQAILFFGAIRPYKGVEDLLAAFAMMAGKKTRLIIAGRCLDDKLGEAIVSAAKKDSRIIYRQGSIPNEDVASYFLAADVVCLPFTAVTTSGVVLLALTFGKPLVVPRIGAIRDLPDSVGILYDPSEKDALPKALKRIVANPAKQAVMARASARYAHELDWPPLAEKTYQLYR